MEEVKKGVVRQGDRLLMESANPSPFYMINGSSTMVDHFEIERKSNEIHGNVCDAPILGGLVDHRQPTENCVSHIMRPIHD